MPSNRNLSALLALFAAVAVPSVAQQVYTAHDYSQAERWMSYNVSGLVHHTISRPTYLSDGRVYFRDPGKDGATYMIADPAKGTVAPAFDNAKLAAAISKASNKTVDAKQLGITEFGTENDGFVVSTRNGKFHCSAAADTCSADKVAVRAPGGRRGRAELNMSPDQTMGAFIRDTNLWVRTIATGAEKQLTTDGAKDFGYATDNAGWAHSTAAILTWSPDSKKIATFQMDERKTGMMYLVPATYRHPQLEQWHYPLVGDKDVTMIEPVIIDVDAAKVLRLKVPALEHRSMECDDISCAGDGKWTDTEFSADGSHLAFVATSRDHKDEYVKVADTATGDVREVYHEHVKTYYGWQSKTDWQYLPASNEFLWVSERGGFAQIYLYNLTTGELKNEVTRGEGPVSDIVQIDPKNRVIYYTALGREKGVDLYYEMLYRVDFDGKNVKLLTPENANHNITMSPHAATFVDVYSTIDTPQTAVLRDNMGKLLVTLGHQDISALLATGWKPPMAVTVKARDGKTPLEGFLWRPTNFDASKKYPVVDNVYPGPQGSLCQLGGRNFAAARGDEQAVADLGFVVVCIDGMGNPGRSKEFHDAHASSPAEMGDDTIPDQVSGIKDLAAKYPWVDAGRVGIWGHSGGGNATASAMFHFPEFFKVGWSESGNHDNRDYEDDWDERWAGLEVIGADGKSNYDAHANQNWAKNLQGHLMLVHGTMDDNVPPSNTLLVADALIKANKNFDMIMVPNVHHGYAEDSQYIMRRRWDYFVQYLAGGVPPTDFKMTTQEEAQKKMAASGPSDDEDDE